MSAVSQANVFITEKRYATVWRRLWAILIDLLLFSPLLAFSFYARHHFQGGAVLTCAIILVSIVPLTYDVVMHARFGQTVGKMVARVEVLDISEERIPSLLQAILMNAYSILHAGFQWAISLPMVFSHSYSLRALMRNGFSIKLLWLTNAWIAIEVIFLLLSRKRRALHDFIAGTVSVRTDWAVNTAPSTPPSAFQNAPTINKLDRRYWG